MPRCIMYSCDHWSSIQGVQLRSRPFQPYVTQFISFHFLSRFGFQHIMSVNFVCFCKKNLWSSEKNSIFYSCFALKSQFCILYFHNFPFSEGSQAWKCSSFSLNAWKYHIDRQCCPGGNPQETPRGFPPEQNWWAILFLILRMMLLPKSYMYLNILRLLY